MATNTETILVYIIICTKLINNIIIVLLRAAYTRNHNRESAEVIQFSYAIVLTVVLRENSFVAFVYVFEFSVLYMCTAIRLSPPTVAPSTALREILGPLLYFLLQSLMTLMVLECELPINC